MKKNIGSILIYIFSLIFLIASNLMAENKVYLRDTIIERGVSLKIPIYGTISFSPIDNFYIELQYDARIINISSVAGAPDYIIKPINPFFQNDLKDLNSAILSISTNDAQSKENGIVCVLELEGLVFSDSIVDIFLNKIVINGIERSEFKGKIGTITVRGQSFLPNFPDNLGLNYPNPFTDETRFEFNLENTTLISFYIYNSSGQAIYSSENTPEIFKVFSYDGLPVNKPFEQSLSRGKYYALFRPPTYDFASGVYFFGLKTDKGFYNRSFLVLK